MAEFTSDHLLGHFRADSPKCDRAVPPHPGLTLRDDVLPALGLRVGEAVGRPGVNRTALTRVC